MQTRRPEGPGRLCGPAHAALWENTQPEAFRTEDREPAGILKAGMEPPHSKEKKMGDIIEDFQKPEDWVGDTLLSGQVLSCVPLARAALASHSCVCPVPVCPPRRPGASRAHLASLALSRLAVGPADAAATLPATPAG